MPPPLPCATIRTQVSVPLELADGFTTLARVFSFDGLVDGRENLAFGLGDRAAPVHSSESAAVPLVRRSATERTSAAIWSPRRCLGRWGCRGALLSNNPDKARQLRRFGMSVTAQVRTVCICPPQTPATWATKARRGAHTLDVSAG